MTTAQITSRIQALQSEIGAERARANTFEASYKSWLADSQIPCSGSGNKRRDCEADRAFKANKAQEQKNTSLASIAQINIKEQELSSLQATLKSQNAQAEVLASKGITLEGELIKASAAADATQIEAAAKAQSVTDADKAAQTRKTGIFIVVAIVVIVITINVLKSKFKKDDE